MEVLHKNRETQSALFEQQVDLATALVEAKKRKISLANDIEEKNNQMYAGSSMTAEYSDEDLAVLKEADEAFAHAVKEFDNQITDRKTFISQLEESGKKDLAKSMAHVFDVHDESLFKRLMKKIAA